MRILIISQYFWPEGFRINDVTEGLIARGHDVTILTGLPNYPAGNLAPGYTWAGPYGEDFHGAKLIRVPLVTRGHGRGLRLILNYLSFAITASLLGLLRCRGTYDAIFVYQLSPVTVGIPARVLAWWKKAPILFWVQDLWPESLSATGTVSNPSILGAVEHLVRWIYKGCARILVQSRAFFEPVEQMGVPAEHIHYFPNSAEALYQPVPAQTLANADNLPNGFRVMFAGNIGAAQSFDTILTAAEKLRGHGNIHWIIVGDGRAAPNVRAQIVARNLQHCFHMMGRHPIETMPAWFANADVMLATLSCDPIFAMTIPAKVQSYLACSKPIIAAINGEGARIVTEAQAGMGVPAEDADALAAAVLDMTQKSAAELAAIGANGRAYFEQHFTRDLLLDNFEQWLDDVTGDDQ